MTTSQDHYSYDDDIYGQGIDAQFDKSITRLAIAFFLLCLAGIVAAAIYFFA